MYDFVYLGYQSVRKRMFSGHVFEFVEEIGRKRRSEIFNGFFSRDDVYISQFFAADLFKAVSVVRRRKKDLPRVYRYFFIVKDVIQFSVGQKGKFPVVVKTVRFYFGGETMGIRSII